MLIYIGLFILTIILYYYVYIIPYFKGVMINDNTCKKYWHCKNNSICCKDPRSGGGACYSVSKCSKMRLEQPSEKYSTFYAIFNCYSYKNYYNYAY